MIFICRQQAIGQFGDAHCNKDRSYNKEQEFHHQTVPQYTAVEGQNYFHGQECYLETCF